MMGGDWMFWLYAVKVFVGAWLIWEMRPFVTEMRWAFSWEAVVVGVLIFVVWVGLDPFYPKNQLLFKDTEGSIWNPFARFGEGSLVAWGLIVVRIFGMTIVVPPLEEAFLSLAGLPLHREIRLHQGGAWVISTGWPWC